jgi:hypothetical protein
VQSWAVTLLTTKRVIVRAHESISGIYLNSGNPAVLSRTFRHGAELYFDAWLSEHAKRNDQDMDKKDELDHAKYN